MGDQLRVISFGGGVQSTALLVLAARGTIDFKIALFSNTGDDSESPATLRYVREIAVPFAQRSGIELHELRRTRKDGSMETLYGRMQRSQAGSVVIPFKLSEQGPPGRRACTADFKVQVISKWLRQHGATKDNPAVVAMGISLDEIQRARTSSGEPVQRICYPLLDLRLDRTKCEALIRDTGLPVPGKSACWFCPMQTNRRWQEMRDRDPETFQRCVDLEAMVNQKRARLGQSQVFLHNNRVPLPMATSAIPQPTLFEGDVEDACESGYCMV